MVSNLNYISNVCILNKKLNSRKNVCMKNVEFTVVPNAEVISRLDIATRNVNNCGALSLEIKTHEGEVLRKVYTDDVADNGYSVFIFEPLSKASFDLEPLIFNIKSHNNRTGILVNPKDACKDGINCSVGAIGIKLFSYLSNYYSWIFHNSPSKKELIAQREKRFNFEPLMSIVTPLYNTPPEYLSDLLDSVLAQTYSNWEICFADGSEDNAEIVRIINKYNDTRIRYKKLENNEGISGNTNAAINMANGEYICFLDHDDTLAPHALFENVKLLNEDNSYGIIYSDEDKITEDGGKREDPFFKPDFSPNLLLCQNYINHFSVINRKLLDEVGYLNPAFDGSQDFDLILRVTEKAKKVGHISDILYHWRRSDSSAARNNEAKPYALEAGRTAVRKALERRNIAASVQVGLFPTLVRVSYELPQNPPLISIIIPNHNEYETLKQCIDSIFEKSTYTNYEIIIIENNSTQDKLLSYYKKLSEYENVKIAEWHHPFNYSALNNFGVSQSNGELLLFLNNDTSVITPDWLEQMAMHAQRDDVGVVGVKLLYPDNTVQHAGVVIGLGGVAGHSYLHKSDDDPGPLRRFSVVNDVSAVTGACMMIKKNIFEEVGGFSEDLPVAFNDIDFCLSVRELGYSNLYTPYAKLYHYESKTRGYEDTPEKLNRFHNEVKKITKKWCDKYAFDPFYNKNLTSEANDFSVCKVKVPNRHMLKFVK